MLYSVILTARPIFFKFIVYSPPQNKIKNINLVIYKNKICTFATFATGKVAINSFIIINKISAFYDYAKNTSFLINLV